ncbi:class D sortase [Virgibacillus siamensis]|uniref:class D sortase n=1 Tax=Virgibacillus siamensis TaxID=480071 RepID=UPI000986AB88|nr:class D sortase [Virgibacillus siamensis]
MHKGMKVLGILLLFLGLIFSTGNLYKWWKGKQSVQTISSTISESNSYSEEKEPRFNEKMAVGAKEEKDQQTVENVSTLKHNFSLGQKIGKLIVPALNKSYSLYWGTNPSVLSQGVGMYVSRWTTVPNAKKGHTVLSGHRDTVFTGLGKLKKGDIFWVTFNGQKRKYRIEKIWVTDANDRTVITKKKKPTLTLTTCYPFDYIGNAPERYIVQSSLISN